MARSRKVAREMSEATRRKKKKMSRSGVCVYIELVGAWSTALLAKPPRRERLACAFLAPPVAFFFCADSIPWAPFKYLRVIDLCLFLSLTVILLTLEQQQEKTCANVDKAHAFLISIKNNKGDNDHKSKTIKEKG
jgi:hypothetical protein